MLVRTLEQGGLSHIVLSGTFSSGDFSTQEKAFIKRVYSGTIEKLVYIDFLISRFSRVPLNKMKPVIRNILRMGIYQLVFMEHIPAYSVIDESVKLARRRGFNNLCPFVNAVLRSVQRNEENNKEDLPGYVKALFPEWLYDLIISQYGEKTGMEYFNAVKKEKEETYIRLNTLKGSEEEIIRALEQEGCIVNKTETGFPDGLYSYGIKGFESLTELDSFKKGLFIVQDPSSMLSVSDSLRFIDENHLTIDVCAAPGGKSLLMAQLFPEARIISRDLTGTKTSLIEDNITRLGIRNIETQTADASIYDEKMRGCADVVIADLPCSGLGVVKKKPDILFRLKKEDLAGLQDLQRSILGVVQNYVKPGGILIYSTCTVNRMENEENAKWLKDNYNLELLNERLLLPGTWEFDGFYYAYFRK